MPDQCPRCGYQPNFWRNKPWGYYCPECAADLKPGKALFTPWKRSLYLLSGIFRVGMTASWFIAARIELELLSFNYLDVSQLGRDEAVSYVNAMTSRSHLLHTCLFYSILFFALLLILQMFAFPFHEAQLRLQSYQKLLDPSARWSGVPIISILLLSAFILLAIATEAIGGPSSELIVRLFANPFLMGALALLILGSTIRNLRASHQPLYPLEWNPAENRFVEVKPLP